MPYSIVDLPWLPAPPEDFATRCRSIGPSTAGAGEAIRSLASTRLSPRQALTLGRVIAGCSADAVDLSPLERFSLGVLAGSTFDMPLDQLPAAAARHGVQLELLTAPYGQVMQEAMDPASRTNAARPDAVLLAVDHRWLNLERPALDGDAQARVESAIGRLRTAAENLRRHGGAAPILQTAPVPPISLFGSFDRRAAGTVRDMIDRANRDIVALAGELGGYLFDVAALCERIGADQWFDPVRWAAYKLPFASECFAAYADALGRLLAAIRGRTRKCLVLDLDNTLWGGVVGDDGVENILIGQGSPRAEAFLAVQQTAMDLWRRGVILAICSKNDQAVARRPFREHPEMLIREAHIAVFQANWIDKPSNLEAIAGSLNIGLDALVLLDDNPAERAQVRAALPMVAVPELPEDPCWFPWFLQAAGYFEAVSFSDEDRLRAQSYAADNRRADVKSSTRDLGDYLASLNMVISFAPFDRQSRSRVTQLINKTNQFNLTTRRYTEAEVASFEADGETFTLQVRLKDAFGDLGMIAVAICRPAPGDPLTWHIDNWLMSCRVLGRQVEQAMLAKVVQEARRRGVRRLVGTYLRTARNHMVEDLYGRLGFQHASEDVNGGSWRLELADYTPLELPMLVQDHFGASAPQA